MKAPSKGFFATIERHSAGEPVSLPFVPNAMVGAVFAEIANTAHATRSEWTTVIDSDFLGQVHAIEADPAQYGRELEQQLRAALGYTERVSALCQRLEGIEVALSGVLKRLDQTASCLRPLWIPIESFAPEPYELSRAITAVIVPSEDGFEASFYDAGLHASGETEEEAAALLKAVILDAFEALSQLGEARLGPGPLRQWKVLSSLIRKTGV
jgi:predicted RNase H-like HicB family nuclease